MQSYLTEEGQIQKEIKLQREATKGLLVSAPSASDGKQEKKKAADQVTVLGSSDSAIALPKLDSSSVEGLQGPTLEEKMRDLGVVEEKVVSNKNVPKSGSLQQVLVQALQTSDNALLEQCLLVRSLPPSFTILACLIVCVVFFFQVRDLSVIQKTVERLPPPFVIPFLTHLIDKFQKAPNRGAILGVWIRITITYHTAYLMTV